MSIEKKLSLSKRGFGDNLFDDMSGIVILELLLNCFYCYSFVQYENSTLILTSRRKLVSYHLSKGFVMLDQKYQDLKNVLLIIKQCIPNIDMLDSDPITNFNAAVPSVENILKKIYLSTTILNKFTSTY